MNVSLIAPATCETRDEESSIRLRSIFLPARKWGNFSLFTEREIAGADRLLLLPSLLGLIKFDKLPLGGEGGIWRQLLK